LTESHGKEEPDFAWLTGKLPCSCLSKEVKDVPA
jgi:hypothetical protein